MTNQDTTLISAKECRRKLGNISAMSLWRWLRDERLDFPKPIVVQRRRYWREADIDNWLKARALTATVGGVK